jgi:hypothetical protein
MTRYFIVSAVLLLASCTSSGPSTDELRGPIGKADVLGTCEGACGDIAWSGECYCDEVCATYGDCCADYEEACPATDVQACGGLLGQGCDAGEYCHYEAEAMCGAADQTGVCLPEPELCYEVYSPVCGCDGVTYSNECFAHHAGTSVSSEGECAPPPGQVCGSRGLPTCDEGQFCDYAPEASCGASDQPGTCMPIPEVCTQDANPACGCDGVTYNNACRANVAGVSVAHLGPCEPAPEIIVCGGFANLQCPEADQVCVDDPTDSCDPDNGGADCAGRCVVP